MAFELAFAVSARVVLALSPLGSYIQDDNQLSSPLTSYSRCKHSLPIAYLISIDLLFYCTYCTSVKKKKPPSTGRYLSIPPRNRPILGRIIQTCTHVVRLLRAYSFELMSHPSQHSHHSHCPSSQLSSRRRGYIQRSFGHHLTPLGHGHW